MEQRTGSVFEAQSAYSGRWLEVHVYPAENSGISLFFRDITAQRESEEAQRVAALLQRAFVKDVLASVTEGRLRLCDSTDELPAPLPACGDGTISLTRTSLKQLRIALEKAAIAVDFPQDRRHDLETAASEAAMNAVVHAGGGVGRVCGSPTVLQVWIEDRGAGIFDPDL